MNNKVEIELICKTLFRVCDRVTKQWSDSSEITRIVGLNFYKCTNIVDDGVK